jgi:branched-chain amino acid transport system ATP-binding protein
VIDTLKVVRSTGTALLIAEQNVPFMALAERCILIEGGRVRLSGTRAQLAKSDAMKATYFGLD